MNSKLPLKLIDLLSKFPNLIVTKKNCPHCVMAKSTLKQKNVDFEEVDGMENQDLVRQITEKEKYKTFPMIYLNRKFIGGNSNLQEYYENEKENIL